MMAQRLAQQPVKRSLSKVESVVASLRSTTRGYLDPAVLTSQSLRRPASSDHLSSTCFTTTAGRQEEGFSSRGGDDDGGGAKACAGRKRRSLGTCC